MEESGTNVGKYDKYNLTDTEQLLFLGNEARGKKLAEGLSLIYEFNTELRVKFVVMARSNLFWQIADDFSLVSDLKWKVGDQIPGNEEDKKARLAKQFSEYMSALPSRINNFLDGKKGASDVTFTAKEAIEMRNILTQIFSIQIQESQKLTGKITQATKSLLAA